VQELAIEELPPVPALIDFAQALFGATHQNRTARAPQLQGLRLRPSRRAGEKPLPGEAALDAFLSGQLARVFGDAERLSSTGLQPWSWPDGEALAWRLERCMAASVTATGRALELAPLPWSPARRTVSAAFHVAAVLARLRASPLSQRASMHATLALGRYGFAEREGLPLHEAARTALPALLAQADSAVLDPHRLRVCALVRAATEVDHARSGRTVLPLLQAAYELERRRCPADLGFDLSRADLQAWLAAALGGELHPSWGRALLGVLGLIPAGCHVLADGRLGVVIAPSDKGDPYRPRVLVGGQVAVPEHPVRICSPLAMTPWAKSSVEPRTP
jgi:hypothetical protein